jgi:hypothetical protein
MQSYNQNIIRHKTELLNLAAELGNISKRLIICSERQSLRNQTRQVATLP